MSLATKKVRLGDLLIDKGEITEDQLMTALDEQKKSGRKLGQTMIDLGIIEEDKLLDIIAEQLDVPFVRLNNYSFDAKVVARLPEAAARRYRAIALSDNHDGLLIGMSDPIDLIGYDELVKVIGQPFNQAVVRESDLLKALDTVYRNKDEINDIAEELDGELSDDVFDLASLSPSSNEDAPVVKLLRSVFEEAVASGASDIHIEPDETVLRIRQRIDGKLHEQIIREQRIASAVILRLKLLCGLNISEKRLPQDGRFSFLINGRAIDVRVSTLPVQYGESVVMRLLDQDAALLDLDGMGMDPEILYRFRRLFHKPHGILLVTGPTGSGKTTTLYGALNELNQADTKIITCEDPVEYRLPRLTQVQVNSKIGLDFAAVLRSALRQDPDVVLVGEMRDSETAEIGLRAAMTGHLVLSTLHTNDAIASATRLIDMGMEPYLVASALLGVLSQRLVRKICSGCQEHHELSPQEIVWLSSVEFDTETRFSQGHGCHLCGNTGYKGRTSVHELLEMNEHMLTALQSNDHLRFNQVAAASAGYEPLGMQALKLAAKGLTTLDEVFRVSGETAEVTPQTEDVPLHLEIDSVAEELGQI